MNPHSRYANAEHDFNKQCRLFQRICSNLFTVLGVCGIIKARNEERNKLYECFNYTRFSIMREIENFDETIYSNNDFKGV